MDTVRLTSILLIVIMGVLGINGCKSISKMDAPKVTFPDVDLKQIESILSTHFEKKVVIKSMQYLSESDRRNQLVRFYIDKPMGNVPTSVILKRTVIGKNEEEGLKRFASDYAGLKFLSTIPSLKGFVPAFYGGNVSQYFILLEDLGETHRSLVDSLTGSNEKEAERALKRFVTSLAKLHASTRRHTESYLQIYREASTGTRSWQDDMQGEQEGILQHLEAALKTLGLPLTDAIVRETRLVIAQNIKPGPFTTYVHGDICPDNVFDNPNDGHLYLIDFEHGKIRNALLDGTYLRMGMPTCWCAKAIPPKLVDSLEMLYRNEIKKTFLEADDDRAYHSAFEDALGFWMLTWLKRIPEVMEKDRTWGSGPVPKGSLWKPEQNLVRPRIISRLQAFLAFPSINDRYANLRLLVKDVLVQLETKWESPKPMDFYPPFQHQQNKK